jgi:hypothetical protein
VEKEENQEEIKKQKKVKKGVDKGKVEWYYK